MKNICLCLILQLVLILHLLVSLHYYFSTKSSLFTSELFLSKKNHLLSLQFLYDQHNSLDRTDQLLLHEGSPYLDSILLVAFLSLYIFILYLNNMNIGTIVLLYIFNKKMHKKFLSKCFAQRTQQVSSWSIVIYPQRHSLFFILSSKHFTESLISCCVLICH